MSFSAGWHANLNAGALTRDGRRARTRRPCRPYRGAVCAGPTPAVAALLSAYPRRFSSASAAQWVAARRSLLAERASPSGDATRAVSSGCAAGAALAHTRTLAEDAARALARLDAGTGTTCEVCATPLAFERLDGAPAAVRCTGCARPFAADTRWCR